MPIQPTTATQENPTRAEQRRAQLLGAAADCFRREGFHGASIARISQAAGMSPGHIYHYFENKEAIIAAIVEQQVVQVLDLTAAMRAAPDVREAMLARVADAVAEHGDPDTAALRLEIAAEAARNPSVGRIVQDADRRMRAGLCATLRQVREGLGHRDTDAGLAALVELVAGMFEGLQIRVARHPELERSGLVDVLRRTLALLLDAQGDGRG